jgi:signal transduction histidine kinase
MRLAEFILRNIDPIVDAWEAFAATQLPAARVMTPLALRNHAEHILRAVAKDIASAQSSEEQLAKSLGLSPPIINAPETAAQTHGMLRAKSGFDLNQMASEYRALRASVLREWMQACSPHPPHVDDIIRFNEAIDQALAESIAFYTECAQHGRNLFLGMLGHDMRTPLQAILATATYLGATNPDTTVTEAAARLIRSGNRMQSLLNDLVDFNRINLGLGIAVHRDPAELGEFLTEAVSQLRAAHPDRRIELEVHGSTSGSWDAASLQRMLDNLVGNALKMAPRTHRFGSSSWAATMT